MIETFDKIIKGRIQDMRLDSMSNLTDEEMDDAVSFVKEKMVDSMMVAISKSDIEKLERDKTII